MGVYEWEGDSWKVEGEKEMKFQKGKRADKRKGDPDQDKAWRGKRPEIGEGKKHTRSKEITFWMNEMNEWNQNEGSGLQDWEMKVDKTDL